MLLEKYLEDVAGFKNPCNLDTTKLLESCVIDKFDKIVINHSKRVVPFDLVPYKGRLFEYENEYYDIKIELRMYDRGDSPLPLRRKMIDSKDSKYLRFGLAKQAPRKKHKTILWVEIRKMVRKDD